MYRLMCVLLVLGAVSAGKLRRQKRSVENPVFTDCGKADKVIEFKEVHFSPNPINIPGKLTLTFHAVNTQTLPNMDVDVDMSRKVSWGKMQFNMPILCVAEVGSCKYDDICTRMVEGNARIQEQNLPIIVKLREALAASGAPSQCPIPPSHLNIRNLELDLPAIPSALSSLADGTYVVKYTVLRHQSDVELGCLSVQASVTTHEEEEEEDENECTGWWCW